MQLELEALGKTYDGERWAVRDLALSVPTGSIFGLIGPNGAGKSTALRMVASVMEPSAGSVRYDGRAPGSPEDQRRIRSSIGFLGDGNPLYARMTPVDYLLFFGRCFGMGGVELTRRVDEVLETFGLGAKRDSPSSSLSKGMRQRLLIARCLVHRPALLILDEPADGLDPRGRSDLRNILRDVSAAGATVVISSHILRELDDLCDRVAILQRGKVVVSGAVDEITERYEVSRFVYEICILEGVDRARELLIGRGALVVREGPVEGRDALVVQMRGGEETMADALGELVSAGVRVITCSRVRSRLEDIYERLSEDRVN